MTNGRFIVDSPRPGFENMAIDEMMVESLLSHLSVPTFRFYSWNPFCLSLGFHQSVNDVNYQNLTTDGIDLVRRPTGGRAVFHSGELTYSVVLPNNGNAPSFWYQKIHEAFYSVFSSYQLPVTFHSENDNFKTIYSDVESVPCFISSAKSELLLDGKKFIGSAQRSFGSVILQHGSILLDKQHLRITNYLNYSSETVKKKTADYLENKSASILDFMPEFSTGKFYDDLQHKLTEQLNISFQSGDYLPEEREIIYHFSKKYRKVS